MAVILNASTSTGLVQTADTSGNLELQSNGSTKLTVNSSGVTATSIQGTIVQGTAVASTSGTSIDFTGIPSWAKRITIMFAGVSTNGTSRMLIQLGGSSGIEVTGYLGSATDGTTSSNFSSGFITGGASAANIMYIEHRLTLVSENMWLDSQAGGYSNFASWFTGCGNKTLSAALDRIRITTVNGTDTFDAGSINIQYEG
jgi:hypothetical protein